MIKSFQICGKKRHGKNTISDIISKIEIEKYGVEKYTPCAFAHPIKELTMALFSWSEDEMDAIKDKTVDVAISKVALDKFKEIYSGKYKINTLLSESDFLNKLVSLCNLSFVDEKGVCIKGCTSPRVIFQKIGDEIGRFAIDQDLWASLVPNHDYIKMTDLRRVNEANYIKGKTKERSVIVKVVDPRKEVSVKIEGVDNHTSELEIDLIKEDILIINDGSKKDLYEKVYKSIYNLI